MKTIQWVDAGDAKQYVCAKSYITLSYDGSGSYTNWKPDGIWFILYQDGKQAGWINLVQNGNVMWQAHINIDEPYRKNNSEIWAIKVANFMSQELGARTILAITPYESAKKYAERAGFKYIATLKKSIRKNGELLDQFMLEKK